MKGLRYALPALLWVSSYITTTIALDCGLFDVDCWACKAAGLGHEDYDCSPVTCLADWPSQSENYDSDTRSGPGVAVNLEDGEMTVYLISTDKDKRGTNSETIHDIEHHQGLLFDSPLTHPQRRDSECCRPTFECWHFLWLLASSGEDNPDDRSLETWKKIMCCVVDYLIPKDWCPNPSGDWPVVFNSPPICSPN